MMKQDCELSSCFSSPHNDSNTEIKGDIIFYSMLLHKLHILSRNLKSSYWKSSDSYLMTPIVPLYIVMQGPYLAPAVGYLQLLLNYHKLIF